MTDIRSSAHQTGGQALEATRTKAMEALNRLPFPTRKMEEWRFNDLKTLGQTPFTYVNAASAESVALDGGWLDGYRLPECPESTLVFVDGHWRQDLSSFRLDPSMVSLQRLSSCTEAPALALFDTIAPTSADHFTALHGSTIEDAVCLHVAADARVEAPIHVLNIQTALTGGSLTTFRLFIHMSPGSDMTLIEEHVSMGDESYLSIPVIESFLETTSRLNHLRIQRENKRCHHFSRPVTHLAEWSEYHSYTIALGARLFRNEPLVIQAGEHVDFTVDGLILIDGDQVSDTHSVMDHRHPNGHSHQLHKVVVNGSAHSIFNGKIFVRRDAQLIDSFQENRNLLLSDHGLVNTKPQLEIFADDVKCSHGATIGQLDPDEVFYLQSRGMTEEKAKEVLTYAFALETIENIQVESVHRFLIDEVKAYTSRNMRSRIGSELEPA